MSHPQYDAKVEVLGEVFWFRRTAALTRRLEQRFGALHSLAGRCATYNVTQSELAMIYAELIWGEPSAPKREEIEAWVFREGTYKLANPLQQVLLEMVIGNEELRRHEAKRLAEAEEKGVSPP